MVVGAEDGPKLFLSAAIHGDELNGVEIIRQVLKQVNAKNLAGVVVAVPVVNMFGFIDQTRYMPDRRDLNRSFPGSSKGSLASRLAHLFMNEVVKRCDYGIDLHTGSNHRSNWPQIRADLEDEKTLNLAKAFAAPIMIHSKTRDGSLRAAAVKQGIPMLLYEAGEASRFNKTAIAVGIKGVLGVMTNLNMREGRTNQSPSIRADKSVWLRASRSGIFHAKFELGQAVIKGQELGKVNDIAGKNQTTVKSQLKGWIIGQRNNPLVNQGDALIHIALDESG